MSKYQHKVIIPLTIASHFISLLHVLFYLAPTMGDLGGNIGFAWKPFDY
jgi:hypothetical protein